MTVQNLSPARSPRDDLDMNRDVVVRLMLTKAERVAWQQAANAAGLKLSEWIRRRVQGETKIEAPPPPVTVTKPRAKKGGR